MFKLVTPTKMSKSSNISALVLAAGKGTRMKSESPKVAVLLNGKPLISYVIDSLKKSGIEEIYVVVGYKKEEVVDILKNYTGLHFIEQREQLGTGHAVLCAEQKLQEFEGSILVCCGDVPMISSNSFSKLIELHTKEENNTTVLSAEVSNPKGYGRLLRDSKGKLLSIVEEKDASELEKQVKEINTGTYVFESPAVFKNLKSINSQNAQNEYYLPDMVKVCNSQNLKTDSLILSNSLESTGVNSPEDLKYLETLISEGRLTV